MALRRGFQPRSPARSRRQTAWAIGPNAVDLALGASGKLLWTTGIQLVSEAKTTIVRIRGDAMLQLGSATAAFDGVDGAIGLGIVSLDAFNAGVASIPGAQSDPEWPGWIWHSFFHVHQRSGTEGGGLEQGVMQRIPIDSKAMRKFGENEVLFGSLDQTTQGTSVGAFWAEVRVLAKLT